MRGLFSLRASVILVGTVFLAGMAVCRSQAEQAQPAPKWPPLHQAVLTGDVVRVRAIIDKGVSPSLAESVTRLTPLHLAAEKGNLPVVSALLDKDADRNAREARFGATPLHVAVYRGQDKVVDLLLRSPSADVNAAQTNGVTVLGAAVLQGNMEICRKLLTAGAKVDGNAGTFGPLHLAAERGDLDVVDLLIQSGADVNARGENGLTPLHRAAQMDRPEVVGRLLAKGADVNAKSEFGATPLLTASAAGNPEIVKRLLDAKANANMANTDGVTPLHAATQRADTETMTLLLKAGAKVDARRKGGYTPLHLAAFQGFGKTAELLIKNGADPKAETDLGYSSIFLAGENGSDEIVESMARATGLSLTNFPPRADIELLISDTGRNNKWTPNLKVGDRFDVKGADGKPVGGVFPDVNPLGQCLLPMPPDSELERLSNRMVSDKAAAMAGILVDRFQTAVANREAVFEVQLLQHSGIESGSASGTEQTMRGFFQVSYQALSNLTAYAGGAGISLRITGALMDDGGRGFARMFAIWQPLTQRIRRVDLFDCTASLVEIRPILESIGETRIRIFRSPSSGAVAPALALTRPETLGKMKREYSKLAVLERIPDMQGDVPGHLVAPVIGWWAGPDLINSPHLGFSKVSNRDMQLWTGSLAAEAAAEINIFASTPEAATQYMKERDINNANIICKDSELRAAAQRPGVMVFTTLEDAQHAATVVGGRPVKFTPVIDPRKPGYDAPVTKGEMAYALAKKALSPQSLPVFNTPENRNWVVKTATAANDYEPVDIPLNVNTLILATKPDQNNVAAANVTAGGEAKIPFAGWLDAKIEGNEGRSYSTKTVDLSPGATTVDGNGAKYVPGLTCAGFLENKRRDASQSGRLDDVSRMAGNLRSMGSGSSDKGSKVSPATFAHLQKAFNNTVRGLVDDQKMSPEMAQKFMQSGRFSGPFNGDITGGHVKGVLLQNAASVKGGLGGSSLAIIVADSSGVIDPLKVRRCATAVWAGYLSAEGPGISLDPVSKNSEQFNRHNVRYIGQVRNTDLGRVMRETDYLMKKWATGANAPYVEGYLSADDFAKKIGKRSVNRASRFWILPDNLTFSRAGNMLVLSSGRMMVKTEYIDGLKDGSKNEANELFAKWLTDNYNKVAEKYSSYADLFEYAQLTSLATYMRENSIPVLWFLLANRERILTEQSVPDVPAVVRQSSNDWRVQIQGGVEMDLVRTIRNSANYTKRGDAALSDAVAEGTRMVDGPVTFESDSTNYTAAPITSIAPLCTPAQGDVVQTDVALFDSYTAGKG
ncbi:MAG: ankyrin repeat domain-containing protein, partial [bacterium]